MYIAISLGILMHLRKVPTITSLEESLNDENLEVALKDAPQSYFSINEYKDGSPYSTVELDRDSRKYIHVRLNYITEYYDINGEMHASSDYYPMDLCWYHNV